MTDPRRNGWFHSEPRKQEEARRSAQPREVWRAIAIPAVCLIAILVVFGGNRDLAAFWSGQRGWAAMFHVVAIVLATVILLRLLPIAMRRYRQDVAEEDMPPTPSWFRIVLSSTELGQVGGLIRIALARVLDLDGRWPDAVLTGLLVMIGMTFGRRLLRWRAELFGWFNGRLFWSRFD